MINQKDIASWKSTIEILDDKDMMKQIRESEKNIKKNKVKEFNYYSERHN